MRALLSILALYNYDNSIFDNMLLPEGITKEDLTNNLLLELSELEILYPNPDTMKAAIGFWSKKELPVWQKLYDTTKFDYKPLENLYRTEEYTDTETRNLAGSNNQIRDLNGSNLETRALAGTNNETRDLTGTGTHNSTTDNSGTDTNKESVAGFNTTVPALAKQNEQTLGTKHVTTDSDGNTDSGTVNHETSDTGTVNNASTDKGTVNNATTDTGTVERINTANMHGSIGVITPQQMIEQERKVVQFNVIDYIIKSFKNRFCIMIY